MNYLTSEKFSFQSKAVDEKTFGVVKFSGSEGLSLLYRFEIMLVADDPDIDMDEMLQGQATFYIHRSDGSKVPFSGILSQFDLVREVGGFYLYRAILVPRVWSLTLTKHNQIFLDKDPEEIISAVLEDGGLTSHDYEFRLQGSYVIWEYVCQYGESHYNFIARWMERNGMYYFFDQSGDFEKLIITDSKMSHAASPLGTKVTYSPVSGLETFHLDEAVQSLVFQRKQVPRKVLLRDYNYRKPSLEVKGHAEVSDNGQGEMYYYGDHFRTPEEGDKLAQIRSEEQLCRASQFHGESTVPSLESGYTIQLASHFRQDMNRGYLVTAIKHYGNQAAALVSGLHEQLAGSEKEPVYRNTFIAIGDDIQFRPGRQTERPKLHGTINARIDAAGSGQYAELDDHGCYRVILPFDLSGREGGKATAWIRMMQPYIGSDHGMHFPLHKGTEVLLTFIDGDPDRPIIAGAVANPDNPSQVTRDNQTTAKLTTSGGNKIHMEDKEGSEQILLQTPGADTWIRMGMANEVAGDFDPPDPKPPDPPPPDPTPPDPDSHSDHESHQHWKGHAEHEPVKINEDGFGFSTGGSASFYFGINYEVEVSGWSNKFIGGLEHTFILGGEAKEIIGGHSIIVLGGVNEVHWPHSWKLENEHYAAGFKKVGTYVSKIFAGMKKTSVTEEKTSVTESEERLSDEVIDLYFDKVLAGDDLVSLDEVVSEVRAKKNEITESKDEIVIEKDEVTVEKTEMSTEKNEVVVEKNEVNVEKNESSVEKVESNVEKTEIGAEKTEVMTEIFII